MSDQQLERRENPDRREYLAKQYKLTPEQIDVVRNAICIGATDAELEFFLATCKRVDLDPFARQVWFVKRRQKRQDSRGNDEWVDVGRPETGIDGYRTIAERSKEYAGQGPTMWCGADGEWRTVWLSDKPPSAAKVTIYRTGFAVPLEHVALFSEFCPARLKSGDLPGMWRKMPANQIAKCAEAGGFRKAFPRDLSGLVTDVEMEHVDANASTYSAPLKPLDASAALKTINASKLEPATEIVEAPPTTAKQAEPERAVYTASGSGMSELDRELANLVDVITAATCKQDIATIGNVCSEAKKTLVANPNDDRARAIMEYVWPVFAKAWRALPEKVGAR